MRNVFKKLLGYFGISISYHPKSHPDKISTKRIGNFMMRVNNDHIYNGKFIYEQYDKNLPRLASAVHHKYPQTTLIDVGANVGDTVAMIRSTVNLPMICIEGDRKYLDLLRENIAQFQNVTVLPAFVGEQREEIAGTLAHESGTLKIDTSGSADKIVIETIDNLAAEHSALFNAARLFKIDTDGFDAKVLKGARNFISRQHPVIFFEYSERHLREAGDDGLLIFTYLRGLGYSDVIFYDHFGRMMIATSLVHNEVIAHLHNYIANYNSPIPYYDIAVFAEADHDVFNAVIATEKAINLDGPNKLIYNS